MLSSEDRILIAASLDDSLAPDAQARLQELLDHSVEARELDQSLRHERELLCRLVRTPAANDILPNVMRAIESRTAIPRNRQPTSLTRNQRLWMPASLAASVILLAGSSVWLGVQAQQHRELVREQVQSLPIIDDTQRYNNTQAKSGNLTPTLTPTPAQVPVFSQRLPSTDDPSPSLSFSFSNLDRGETRQQLLLGLKRMSDATIEITCSNCCLAAEYLVATGRAVGVNVLIDSTVQDRLRRRLPTPWLVYCKNLSPDECLHWMMRLAVAKTREGGELAVFDNFRLSSTDAKLKEELRTLMNRDPNQTSSNRTPVQIPDPSELGTIALLTSYSRHLAGSDNHRSREVKLFSDLSHARKPDSMALTIVVH